ncbi:eyespot assembly ABC1 kinase family [Chlorella sorokiniana]|uniref:Eyespot assembly ABC1 kinase family n=1 Tax=Chlorella sorokiniana TaxID=3076 RepID=A0A2P6U0V6_CHLSO|nr:eyespot assembly ABC1 kinase family [Chlorella sorokiniana]|eukprot:PRW59939.1 eyespot assembly ABC1 kinase family [Chlorella sorokiniana]
MQPSVACNARRAGEPWGRALPRRRHVAQAAPIPFGAADPAPALPAAPLPGTELVSRVQLPELSIPSLPALQAPSLKEDAAELLEQRATAPHWGSRVLGEAVEAARAALGEQQAAVPGLGALADTLQQAQSALSDAAAQLSALPDQASSTDLAAAQEQVAAQLQRVSAAAQAAASSLQSAASPQSLPGPGDAATSLASQMPGQLGDVAAVQFGGYSLQTLATVTAGVAALVALSVPRSDDDSGPPGSSSGGSGGGTSGRAGGSGRPDVLPSSWDGEAVAAYYRRRPVEVARRVAEVASEAAAYGAALLADMAAGTVDANAQQRADQAMGAIERLGPAYVKVAQALSTRVDLLPPAYLLAIQRLQDRVPPFPDAQAVACIERSFGGQPVGQVFSRLSERAVAAASLGQVYRGMLRSSGQEVAIKVRRPGVLESVCLDLHLMRGAALQLRNVPEVRSDWVAIIDAWASRFLDEMNYELEARNTLQFQRDLACIPGVVVPDVIPEGSSSDVLVLSWVEGERLTDSSAADVRQLCNTLLSAYLHQLCDTGLLHADPHPGNLLRTTDGRIAILDHGLIQEIPDNYAVALLEYIAHLSVGDWDSLADDLVALGFLEGIQGSREALVEPLGVILTQLSAGGGAKKVNIALVLEEIEKLTTVYEFRIPPYFALILRTFSVIEGIALQVDPSYSIVLQCFPYLSKRLLTDDNPRVRAALKQLLFAGQDHISLERLERLVAGVSTYDVEGLRAQGGAALPDTAAAASGSSSSSVLAAQQAQQAQQPLLDSTAKEVLQAVFSERPTYVQELLVEEAASTVDAAGRQLASLLLGPLLNAGSGRPAVATTGLLGGGAPLPPALALLDRLPALVELSPDDRQQLATARGVVGLVRQQAAGQPPLTPQQAQQLASELAPLLPQLLPGIAATGQRFLVELGKRAYSRVESVGLVGPAGPAPQQPREDVYTAMDP